MLELGCGPGELWAENAERIPPGWRITLTDLSPGMVEAARERVGERAAYGIADAAEIPFPDESFDLVIANHVLFHVAEPERALGEVRRVLRPGGRFVASLLGPEHLRELYPRSDASRDATLGLHNAGPRLERFFVDVRCERYDGHLAVTELEPVLAFVRSGFLEHAGFLEHDLDELRGRVDREIRERGFFHVTRDVGVFRALRG